ncbi:MAG: hypothetical protein ACLPUT_04760 [Solirubrobacteraceae bacterium]
MGSIRIKTVLLALVAAFAMSLVASATASAAVPLLPLLLNKEGKDLSITLFKGKSGASTFETKSGSSVKCKADTITGNITGLSTDEAEIKFTGCTATLVFTLNCKTPGAASGEIILKVTSLLVWINVAKEEPGEDDILPSGGLTIECTGVVKETLKVKGSTICPTTKNLSKTATITCTQTKGVQAPTEYEMEGGSKVKDITETEGTGAKTFGFEESGLTGIDELEFDEEVQIT